MGFKIKDGKVTTDKTPISTAGQPGPTKVLKNIVRGGAKKIGGEMVNSVPKKVAGAAGTVLGRAFNIGGVNDSLKQGKQYESITKKLQRGRGIPKEVIRGGGAKDPARQAALDAFHARGQYNLLSKGK